MTYNNLDPWAFYNEQRSGKYTEFLDSLGVAVGPNEPRDPAATIKIDTQKFIDYVLVHKDTCQAKWFHPRDFLSASSNFEMGLPLDIGMHQGNTMEYNWGLYAETNEEIKQLIGLDNLEAAGFVPDTVLARLIVYMPGHGIPWHRDSLDGWSKKFEHLAPDIKNSTCDLGEVQRRLLMITDWHWGHMLQLNNTVLSHWNRGDVYKIPLGEWHLSANQGIMPKITISLTGVVHA